MVALPGDLMYYAHRSGSCQEGIFSRDQKEKKDRSRIRSSLTMPLFIIFWSDGFTCSISARFIDELISVVPFFYTILVLFFTASFPWYDWLLKKILNLFFSCCFQNTQFSFYKFDIALLFCIFLNKKFYIL